MSFFNAVRVRYGRRLVKTKELAGQIMASSRHMNPALQLGISAMLVVMFGIQAKAQTGCCSVVPNLLVTGNGTQTTSFAAAAGFPTMSASAQISMNTSNTGNNRGAALDLYTGSSGIPLRIWADDSNYTGGKELSTIIGAGIVTRNSLVVSGNVSRYSGNPFNATILTPTPDPAMIEVWSDVNAPALVVSPGPGAFFGSAGNPGYQAAVFMDGRNERLAIDAAGTMQWSPSVSNTFIGSHWDTTFGRVAPGVVATQAMQLSALLVNAPYAFVQLPAPTSVPSGSQVFCRDCILTAANGQCSAGGGGAMAFAIAGNWICN